MRQVSPQDQMFLLMEGRNQPMHVGSLVLLRPPADASPEYFADIVQHARESTQAYAPFNQKLVKKMGMWFWEDDKEFEVEAHLLHVALPKPGRIRELLSLVSKLHSGLLDRAKPLWEVAFIEGVEDGRAALYFKMHHAMADGIAGARMLQRAMSDDPAERDITPIWARAPKGKESKNTASTNAASSLGAVLRAQVTVAKEVAKSMTTRDPEYVSPFQAPPSILNQAVSASRRFAAQSWSLDRVKAAAKLHGVTLNDVVLGMCASALRHYLFDLGALPEKPLIAMVPVSLRRDESDSGNQIALVLANLSTHIADPVERLKQISASMKYSKKRYAGMTQLEILQYVSTTMGLAGINSATGIAPTKQAFNVIISNVPGPQKKLYYEGSSIEGIYPVSIVLDGQAINITLQSYADKLEFGIIACRRTVPRMQRLLKLLEQGLTELEPAAGKDDDEDDAMQPEPKSSHAPQKAPKTKAKVAATVAKAAKQAKPKTKPVAKPAGKPKRVLSGRK